jgi:hypothetical protein
MRELTREEVLAMEPGRELDMVVGRKLSGWWQPIDGLSHLPRYSTKIDAAWEVVDKLKIAVIPQSIGAPNDMKYLAKIEDHPHEYQSFARTAPLAICRCALLAVLEATP